MDQRLGEVRLVALAGEPIGRTFALRGNDVLGRGDEADLRMTHEGVSRRHARIHVTEDGYTLEDLGSRNGTLHNGHPAERALLSFGDRIQLGAQVVLLFTREDPAGEVLAQHQRFETMATMAAGIAHDFNNLLGVVVACFEGIQEELGAPNKALRECLEDGTAAASQATDLARRLLALARTPGSEPGHAEAVDLSGAVQGALPVARRALPPTIDILVDAAASLPVRADPTELQQVLMNLLVNARDAMPEGGALRIRTHRVERHIEPSPVAHWAVLSVADEGVGMDAEVRRRIFEPFFTTKRRAGGNGLGLATVATLLHRRGGCIRVRSKRGGGTTFELHWPLAIEDEAAPGEASAIRTKIRISTLVDTEPRRRLLLIDDEPLLTRSLMRLLSREAHVEAVHTAEGGLGRLRQAPRVDMVLLDMRLPDAEGDELLARIKAAAGDVPVVVYSGELSGAEERRLVELGAAEVLPKPTSASCLRATVARQLRRS